MKCSICKLEGHNKRTCKKIILEIDGNDYNNGIKLTRKYIYKTKNLKNDKDIIKHFFKKKNNMENNTCAQHYNNTITEIKTIARSIVVNKSNCDGRIDSAIKETEFLNELKRILLEKYPTWDVLISPPRASCDIIINNIRINLKLTECKSSDNSVNKQSIYYSITGLTKYPYSSNWNEFLDCLNKAKKDQHIKKQRDKQTEYHYLVKNKLTGDVILKPIFDIHTYVSNSSNDLQINWKNEFKHSNYQTEDKNYLAKVQSLLNCIQKSVKDMIDRTKRFAEADIEELLI